MFCSVTCCECAGVGKGDSCPLLKEARAKVIAEGYCPFAVTEDGDKVSDLRLTTTAAEALFQAPL